MGAPAGYSNPKTNNPLVASKSYIADRIMKIITEKLAICKNKELSVDLEDLDLKWIFNKKNELTEQDLDSMELVITCILGILPSVSVYTTQLIMNQIQKKELAVYSIIMLCILYIAVDMVSTILNYVQSYNTFIINQKIDLALIENVLKKTKELELGDFETPEINDLISRANEQTSGKAYAFYMLVLGIFQSFLFKWCRKVSSI